VPTSSVPRGMTRSDAERLLPEVRACRNVLSALVERTYPLWNARYVVRYIGCWPIYGAPVVWDRDHFDALLRCNVLVREVNRAHI
jgi:hypothetical protein